MAKTADSFGLTLCYRNRMDSKKTRQPKPSTQAIRSSLSSARCGQPWQSPVSSDVGVAELRRRPTQRRSRAECAQLRNPYREGGGEVRAAGAHIADSNMNLFIRVSLAISYRGGTDRLSLSETTGSVHDSPSAPIEWSIELLEAL